jgi:hypothetical protein
MTKIKLGLFIAEILAVVLLRLVLIARREQALPKSSRVATIRGKPVYRIPPIRSVIDRVARKPTKQV